MYGLIKRAQNILINQLINNHCWPLAFSHDCMSVYVQNLVLQIDPMNMRLRRRSVRVDRTDGGPALHPSISSQLWTQPLTYLKLKLHINLHGTCISW